jgi:guanidinopropionase
MSDYTPLSGRENPRFAAIKTFFRLPYVDLDADYEIGICGIPFDGGVSYRPGARFAPSKVREVSSLGRVYHWSKAFSFVEKLKVADIGDCPVVPIDLLKTYEKIQKFYAHLLSKNKRVIAVGGDHSITLPILREMKKKYGQAIRLVHFDAHLDTYPAAWDCEYHHGSFLRHAIEEGLVDAPKSLHIGIRGPLAAATDLDAIQKYKMNVLTIDDLRADTLKNFCAKLPDFGSDPTYITFDIDGLDPAYAPGTGTPVVGGMTTYETQQILRSLKIKNLIGADIVEVSPPFDHSDITALAALDTMFEMICIFAQGK